VSPQREVTLSIYLAHSLTRVDKIMFGVEIEKGDVVAAWENELFNNAFSYEKIRGFVQREGLKTLWLSLELVNNKTTTSYGTYYDLRRP
jgi:hypothetical protein